MTKKTVELISQNLLRIHPRHTICTPKIYQEMTKKSIINLELWTLSFNWTIGKNITVAKVLLTYFWWLKRVCDTRNNLIFKLFKWRIRKRRAMKMKRLWVSRRRLKNHMAALRGQAQKSDNIPESGLHPHSGNHGKISQMTVCWNPEECEICHVICSSRP